MMTNKEIIKDAMNYSSEAFFKQNEFTNPEEFRINDALIIQKKQLLEMLQRSKVDHYGECGCMIKIEELFVNAKVSESQGGKK